MATQNQTTSVELAVMEETKPLRRSVSDGHVEVQDGQAPKSPQSCVRRCCACPIDVCTELRAGCRQVDCRKILRETFSFKTLQQRVPVTHWLPKYTLHQFQGDIIAGITVGLTVIPQSLAYAKIAELPPQYGLYTAFMACFVYFLLGTSKDVNLGPAAVMSLLVAEFGHSVIHDDATYAIALSLVCGVFQIVMGILHAGFLVDYISHPVINSFTTAAAITIAASQLKKWLGLHGIPRGFIPQIYTVLKKLPQTQVWDFSLGLVCMICLYLLKRLKEIKWRKPNEPVTTRQKVAEKSSWIISTARNAIIVIIASSMASVLYHNDINKFTLTGNITSGIPTFKAPSFTLTHDNHTYSVQDFFQNLGLGVVMVPLVGIIEIIAVGKAFGRKFGYNVDGNQELMAIGISNLLGAFVSAYPVTASFSRSAVNAQSGSMTTAAGIFTGALVLLALAFLTPMFYYIPDAALAAVIIMAVTDMINFSMVKHLWTINKVDLLPWLTAFFVSLGVGFEYGILLGVVVSLLILLYPWARPQITVTTYEGDSTKQEQTINILIVNISMGLTFPGVEHLQEKITAKAFQKTGSSSVIVDMTSVCKMDYTSATGIGQLVEDFAKTKSQLVFINLQSVVLATLERAKVKVTHADSLTDAVQLIHSSGLTDASQPAGQQDEDHQPSTTTAAAATSAVVAADGRLVQNGRGDGVAMATTGARQRSVDSPSD